MEASITAACRWVAAEGRRQGLAAYVATCCDHSASIGRVLEAGTLPWVSVALRLTYSELHSLTTDHAVDPIA
jgi:hypothetical protein